jgi:hypothetical protein
MSLKMKLEHQNKVLNSFPSGSGTTADIKAEADAAIFATEPLNPLGIRSRDFKTPPPPKCGAVP